MNNKNRTTEQRNRDKIRYLFLQQMKLCGKSYRLKSPFSGKNKAQRARLAGSFACLKNGLSRIERNRYFGW